VGGAYIWVRQEARRRPSHSAYGGGQSTLKLRHFGRKLPWPTPARIRNNSTRNHNAASQCPVQGSNLVPLKYKPGLLPEF
jgi:hypothetical protein